MLISTQWNRRWTRSVAYISLVEWRNLVIRRSFRPICVLCSLAFVRLLVSSNVCVTTVPSPVVCVIAEAIRRYCDEVKFRMIFHDLVNTSVSLAFIYRTLETKFDRRNTNKLASLKLEEPGRKIRCSHAAMSLHSKPKN